MILQGVLMILETIKIRFEDMRNFGLKYYIARKTAMTFLKTILAIKFHMKNAT